MKTKNNVRTWGIVILMLLLATWLLFGCTQKMTVHIERTKMIQEKEWIIIEKKNFLSDYKANHVEKKLDKLNNNRERTVIETTGYYMIRKFNEDTIKDRWEKLIKEY